MLVQLLFGPLNLRHCWNQIVLLFIYRSQLLLTRGILWASHLRQNQLISFVANEKRVFSWLAWLDNRMVDVIDIHEHILDILEIGHGLEVLVTSVKLSRHMWVVLIVNMLWRHVRILSLSLELQRVFQLSLLVSNGLVVSLGDGCSFQPDVSIGETSFERPLRRGHWNERWLTGIRPGWHQIHSLFPKLFHLVQLRSDPIHLVNLTWVFQILFWKLWKISSIAVQLVLRSCHVKRSVHVMHILRVYLVYFLKVSPAYLSYVFLYFQKSYFLRPTTGLRSKSLLWFVLLSYRIVNLVQIYELGLRLDLLWLEMRLLMVATPVLSIILVRLIWIVLIWGLMTPPLYWVLKWRLLVLWWFNRGLFILLFQLRSICFISQIFLAKVRKWRLLVVNHRSDLVLFILVIKSNWNIWQISLSLIHHLLIRCLAVARTYQVSLADLRV